MSEPLIKYYEIPVGETITLDWPGLGAEGDEYARVALVGGPLFADGGHDSERDYLLEQFRRDIDELVKFGPAGISPIDWNVMLRGVFESAAPNPLVALFRPNEPVTGKRAPTGILTVHEGRVGGVPMCSE